MEQQRRYAEARCGAAGRGARSAAVARASGALRVSVEPIALESLVANASQPGRMATARLFAVRVRMQSAEPVPRVRLTLRLRSDSPWRPVANDLASLAHYTGERLPEPTVTATERNPGDSALARGVMSAIEHPMLSMLYAVTFGGVDLLPGGPTSDAPVNVVVAPTAAEVRREAPVAVALQEALYRETCEPFSDVGACEAVVVWERPRDEATTRATVELSVHDHDPYCQRQSDAPTFERVAAVPLPQGGTLESRLRAAFGPQPRAFSQLATP